MKLINTIHMVAALALIMSSVASLAADEAKEIDEPAGIDSEAAYEMLLKNPPDTFMIDVRTRAEYLFVGHPDIPSGVPNIPLKFYPSWETNKDFVKDVEERYKKADAIIVICRSGKRAKIAGQLLLDTGFNNIFYMTDSFEGPKDTEGHRTVSGWKVNGLPYTHTVKDDLIYK